MKELAMQNKNFVFGADDFREIDESMEVSGNVIPLVLYIAGMAIVLGVGLLEAYCSAHPATSTASTNSTNSPQGGVTYQHWVDANHDGVKDAGDYWDIGLDLDGNGTTDTNTTYQLNW